MMTLDLILFELARLFQWPVALGVVLCFVYAVYVLGMFGVEFLQRRRNPTRALLLHAYGNSQDQMELAVLKDLEGVRLCSRVAPMLGLIATMIPMGPALKSLSDGNLAQVSENLTIAFSAVILALIAASITYWVVNVRRRWLAEELLEIEALRSQQA